MTARKTLASPTYIYKISRNPNSSTLQKAAMQIGKWPYFRILGVFTLHYQSKKGRVLSSFLPKKPNNVASPTPISCCRGNHFRQKKCYPFPQMVRFLHMGHHWTSRLKSGCQMLGYAKYCVTTRKTLWLNSCTIWENPNIPKLQQDTVQIGNLPPFRTKQDIINPRKARFWLCFALLKKVILSPRYYISLA